MLEQIGKHGGIDLTIKVKGDLEVDEHHTIEDTAIALGECIYRALAVSSIAVSYTHLVFLDANENPYNTPNNRYPDPMQRELKNMIAPIKKVDPDRCV